MGTPRPLLVQQDTISNTTGTATVHKIFTRRPAYLTVKSIPATHSSVRSFYLLATTSFRPITFRDLYLLFLHQIFVFDTHGYLSLRIHATAAYNLRSGLGYQKPGVVEENEGSGVRSID